MQTQSSILLVSIVDVTCAEAQRQGFTKLGLLGAAATMDGVFFKRPFERAGMEIATPSDAEKEWIEQKITDELEFGIVKPETVSEFQKIVKRMAEQNGIQAVMDRNRPRRPAPQCGGSAKASANRLRADARR